MNLKFRRLNFLYEHTKKKFKGIELKDKVNRTFAEIIHIYN
jgi:hypothetical protein